MSEMMFQGKLAIQQRVLPDYRKVFFNELASKCTGGLSIFAGTPMPLEEIRQVDHFDEIQLTRTSNINILDPSSKFYFCWQRGFVDFLEESRPDALIIESNPRYLSTVRAIRWMHNKGFPVIGWGLGLPADGGIGHRLRGYWQKRFIEQLDAVIVYSSKGAAEYENAGFSKERIYVSFNAVVQTPAFNEVVKQTRSNTRSVLLFVGRLQRRKNLDVLFSACATLPESYKPEILVVGDGPYRSTFEQQAAITYPETRFLGSVYGEDLEKIYRQADLFVLPGTGGLAVQQAMAHGFPVIVGKGDGTQSDLVRPENGWILPENDPESLSDLLQHALSDSNKLSSMGLESYRIVRDEVNIGTMSDVFVTCLNDVSNGGAGK